MKNLRPATESDSQPLEGPNGRRAALITLSSVVGLLAGLEVSGNADGSPEEVALFLKILGDALDTGDVRKSLAKFGGGKALPLAPLKMLESLKPADLKVLGQFRSSIGQLDREFRNAFPQAL